MESLRCSVLLAAAVCVAVLGVMYSLLLMHMHYAYALQYYVHGSTREIHCSACDVSRSASITNSMLLLCCVLLRRWWLAYLWARDIWWLGYLVVGLIGRLACWSISMYGACERVYLLYRIYSIHARARARHSALVVLCVLYALQHYTILYMYSLLVCTYMVYTVCLYQWVVRITALCIKVANALTIHGYAYCPSLLY